MLQVEGLAVGHGKRTVLRGIDLTVETGQVLAVLGANGIGKTTLLRTLAGLLSPHAGTVRLDGRQMEQMSVVARTRAGLVLVPDGHQSFHQMTVSENLAVAVRSTKRRLSDEQDRIFEMFPRLADRAHQSAGTLSGGERQMLAIGRALLGRPQVLMLDEPSHGLAPVILEQLGAIIARVAVEVPVLLVEQNLSVPRRCATDVVVLGHDGIAMRGPAAATLESPEIAATYLGATV